MRQPTSGPAAAARGRRPRAPGGLEARLAGVVVAALKEAFDRDTRRLELEREQLDAERERAERALRLELQRQAADREIGRLRLLAGVAVAGWLGTLLLAIWPRQLAWSRPSARASRSAADGCSSAPRSPRRSVAQAHGSRRVAASRRRTNAPSIRCLARGRRGALADRRAA